MRVEWQPQALDQLEAVYDYIAQENQPAARRLIEKILDQTDRLGDHPKLGRPRSDYELLL
jgi:plasmid stabilization system protein ParE